MERILVWIVVALLSWTGAAQAQGGNPDPATINPLTAPGNGQLYVIEYGTDFFSYVFKVNQPLQVNAVGVGITTPDSPTVTFKLFDASGTNLIDQPVKPYTNETTVLGAYSYKGITPLTLQTGIYVLAVGPVFSTPETPAYVNYVEYHGQDQGAYISPLITLLGGSVIPTSQFTSATASSVMNSAISNYGTPDYLSSTFLTGTLSALPVPEPEIYTMVIAGLAVFGFVCRRRRV